MFQGALKLLSGFHLLLTTASLRSVLWRMLGLLTALMALLLVGVFFLSDMMMQAWLPDGQTWYWMLLSWMVWTVSILLAVLTGIVGFAAVASAAVAPWLDILAVRTEQMHGIHRPENADAWWKQCSTALIHSIRPISILILWGMLAVLLSLIPVLGQIAAAAVWMYASIHFLCFELMDTTATRQGWSFSQRKAQLKEHRLFWLSFGGLAMLLMTIPLLNLLVIPAAVVALSQPNKIEPASRLLHDV